MKKTILLLTICLLAANISVTAQTQKKDIPVWKWAIEPQFEKVENFSEGLARAEQNGKYGFIDKTGKWIIQPQFDNVKGFSEGLALAEQNGKYGFIDKTGKWIILPKFEWVSSFSEGLARAYQNGKLGFIDKTGKWIIQPQFSAASNFSEGLAYVKNKKDWKYGFIDKTGKWIIKPQFVSAGEFSEGLALVNQNGKYGFIDKTGKWIILPQFSAAMNFSKGLARAKQNDKWGFIDKSGKRIIQTQLDDMMDFSEGLASAYQNDKWGFIDKSGKWIIQTQIDDMMDFSEGLASAYQNDKWGFIDKSGKWIILPQFDDADNFSEGLAAAEQNGKWGFISLLSADDSDSIKMLKDELTVRQISQIDEVPDWFLQPQAGEYVGVSFPLEDDAFAESQAIYTALLSYMAQHDITAEFRYVSNDYQTKSEVHLTLPLYLPEQYQVSRITKNKYGEVFVALCNVSEPVNSQVKILFSDHMNYRQDSLTREVVEYTVVSEYFLEDDNKHFSVYGEQMHKVGRENELNISGIIRLADSENKVEYFDIGNKRYTYSPTINSSVSSPSATNSQEDRIKIQVECEPQSLQVSLGAAYLAALLKLLSNYEYWDTTDYMYSSSTKRKATPIKSMEIENNYLIIHSHAPTR